MDLYGKGPQQQAIQTLIHDSNGGLGFMRSASYWIKKFLEVHPTYDNNKHLELALKNADLGYNRTRETLDAYYIKVKNDFQTR